MSKVTLEAVLTAVYTDYITAAEAGGHIREFQHRVDTDAEENPEKYNRYLREALAAAAAKMWEREPKIAPDLFSIGGQSVQQTFTFPDRAVASGFRRIHQDHANVDHVREDAIVTIASGARVVAKGNEKMETANRYLAMANDDPRKRLRDLAD